MLFIQPGSKYSVNIELTPIIIFISNVGHGNAITGIMSMDIVLVLECLPIYTLTTSPIPMSDIPSLYHKSRNNPVESTALVMQILATLSFSFFSGTESTEIL